MCLFAPSKGAGKLRKKMFGEHISSEVIFFFIFYGITGAVPLMASVYLLLRRGNAFASGVEPPLRLRRWAASFFAMAALGHVWWYLFLIYSCDIQSACYVVVCMLDCVTLLTTMAGTLLAMLQDRKRPIWPAFAVMIPFIVFGVLQILFPKSSFIKMGTIYIMSVYILFSVYMVFAVRQYGRWLNDNYADLENKKVWLSQTVFLVCLLLFLLYGFVDTDTIFILHVIELVSFALLLWRVETLPQLESPSTEEVSTALASDTSIPPSPQRLTPQPAAPATIELAQIERLLKEHCVDKQLYLQHNLSLQQLAQTVGTNRYYLSLYFSRQGITYNTYINNLRVNHFIGRYQELTATGQPIVARELAYESGFSSYRTFSRAFTQRMGRSVTDWMRDTGNNMP